MGKLACWGSAKIQLKQLNLGPPLKKKPARETTCLAGIPQAFCGKTQREE